MNRIAHFEIHADNPKRAIEFYKKVFGWQIGQWKSDGNEYWLIMTACKDSKEPGINGGLLRRQKTALGAGFGANSFVCTIHVEEFDKISKKIETAGGKAATSKFDIAGMV